MGLSIFNSDKRVCLTLCTAAVAVLMLSLLNIATYMDAARGKDGTEAEKKFWRSKILPKQKYDMVFLGDSRMLCAIDPGVFDKTVGNSSYNGAFTGGSINKEILEHTEKNLLKSSGTDRAVILGITPMTMADQSRGNGQFAMLCKEVKEKGTDFADIMDILFGDIRTKEIKDLFKKRIPDKIYHVNGWLEKISEVKPKARRSNLHGYKIYFNTVRFSGESLQEILDYTQKWQKQGIVVFAFRMPTMPEMDKLEDELSKCDFAMIKKRLEAAGGVWLEVKDRSKYNSYDGSHLERNDAGKLSADLAMQIKKYFSK